MNIIEKFQELKRAQKSYRDEVAGKNRVKEVNRFKDRVYQIYQEIKEMNKEVPTDNQKGRYDPKLN